MFVSLLPYPKPALFMVVEYIDLENMQGGSDAYELNIAQDQETVARVERLGHRMSYMVSDGMSGKRFFLAAFQFHPGELDEFEMGFRILWK
jgi:ribosomal protein S6